MTMQVAALSAAYCWSFKIWSTC